MEELRKQEESRQQRIIKAKEGLAAAEAELENLPPYEPPKDELVSNFSSQLLIFSGGVGYDVSLSTYGHWRLQPLTIYGTDFVVNCLEVSWKGYGFSYFAIIKCIGVPIKKKKEKETVVLVQV